MVNAPFPPLLCVFKTHLELYYLLEGLKLATNLSHSPEISTLSFLSMVDYDLPKVPTYPTPLDRIRLFQHPLVHERQIKAPSKPPLVPASS